MSVEGRITTAAAISRATLARHKYGFYHGPSINIAILTFVDRLTKYVCLIPTTVTSDAQETARLYVNNIFAHHGLSKTIVCDRDPQFTSVFFKEVFSALGVDLKMSMANHPQPDGMTERVN